MITRTILVLLCLSMFTAWAPADAQGPSTSHHFECTNKDLQGEFGFHLSGTNASVGLYAIIGRFSADGNGNVTGTSTANVSGVSGTAAFTAVYAIEKTCTGEVVLSFDNGIGAELQLVLESNGTEVDFIEAGANGQGGLTESGSATVLSRPGPFRRVDLSQK
jgi:hypothetical protein